MKNAKTVINSTKKYLQNAINSTKKYLQNDVVKIDQQFGTT